MSRVATISAIKITAEIVHRESEAPGGKLHSNVLVGAIVIGGTGWIFLRKGRADIGSADAAAEAFRPLVPLVHYPTAKFALAARKKSISMIRLQFPICRRARSGRPERCVIRIRSLRVWSGSESAVSSI
jgi:hypothetical protein